LRVRHPGVAAVKIDALLDRLREKPGYTSV
jgi:hypothetical protein